MHYDHILRAIGAQPDGIAYVVFDSLIEDVPSWKRGIRTDQPLFHADGIEALAALCELPAEPLDATLKGTTGVPARRIPAPEDGFPGDQGPRHRQVKLARTISTPPFCAYPIISGVCFTYGGVNTNGQVVDTDGRAIPGFYAH